MGRTRYTAPTDAEKLLENLSNGWPKQILHPLHNQHQLIKTLRPDYTCDSCHTHGKDWSFYCNLCDFDLHPDCTIEAQLVEMAKSWPRTVNHRLHRDHALVKTRLDSYWCDSCGERGNWWCFYCEPCDFGLHLHCADGPKRFEQPERLAREIVKTVRESYWCSKCAEEGKGSCYAWEDCNVYLHPKCAVKVSGWPISTRHQLHNEHELVKSQNNGYYCDKCWTEGQGWSFGCNDCNFHLHPKCAIELPTGNAETGWVDDLLHHQQKEQVQQQQDQLVQQLQQQQEQTQVTFSEEDEDDQGELVISFTGDVSAQERQMKQLEDAALQRMQLESTMNQLEQIRLYSEAIARIQGSAARVVSDLTSDTPNNWANPRNGFGFH